jgi:hypothetical protein
MEVRKLLMPFEDALMPRTTGKKVAGVRLAPPTAPTSCASPASLEPPQEPLV